MKEATYDEKCTTNMFHSHDLRTSNYALVNIKHIKLINGYNIKITDEDFKMRRNKKNDLSVRFVNDIGGIRI